MPTSTATRTSSQILGKRRAEYPHPLPQPLAPRSSVQSSHSSGPSNFRLVGRPPLLVNGKLLPHTRKRYQCTHEGCEKAYSKPSRLTEHERSHTGERPYECETCGKSYLRETHLNAHARIHLPESSRPFVCNKPRCEKRFWTKQHLNVHVGWHEGAKPFSCPEAGCTESFSKHNQLRSHIASDHAPSGTKPYRCEHNECTKSFSTNQQLKAHTKTHDDQRYTCMHSECIGASEQITKYFPTWSALQNHIRNDHPPTCTHPSCENRTFASQKGLRAHMKLHEQRDEAEAIEKSVEDDEPHPTKRRRGGEWGRDWICDYENCQKDFKSKKALNVHKNVTHLKQRNFVCSHENCTKAYGYHHLLQRHIAKCHGESDDSGTEYAASSLPGTDNEDEDETGSRSDPEDSDTFNINIITGNAYARTAQTSVSEKRALRCPFPTLEIFTAECSNSQQHPSINVSRDTRCDYVFRRAYDLRRHLRAAHQYSAQKDSVESWVLEQKLAWYT